MNIFSVSYPHCWKSAPFVRHAVSAEVVPCGVFASADCVSNGSGLGTDSHVLGATHGAIDGMEKMKSPQKAPHATVEMVVDFTLDITKSGKQTGTEELGGEAALAGQVSKTAAPRRLRFARHAGRLARRHVTSVPHAIRYEPARKMHSEMGTAL